MKELKELLLSSPQIKEDYELPYVRKDIINRVVGRPLTVKNIIFYVSAEEKFPAIMVDADIIRVTPKMHKHIFELCKNNRAFMLECDDKNNLKVKQI